MTRVLVTGGAGYIGSHIVKTLGEQGFVVLVYDNLSKGYRESVLAGTLVVADLGDADRIAQVMQEFRPDAIMHFAAFIEVGESVRDPLKYYKNNVNNSVNLLNAAVMHGVKNFIFSSTAAVYGIPDRAPVTEDAEVRPINPYGGSKASVERMLRDLSTAADFRFVSLRYFNAAGADPGGRIGERHIPETHLIPLTLKTAKSERESVTIYGTDYATPDGTCIRDYIHVQDLVDAHMLCLDYLSQGNTSDIFNCGYGHGYSVREVIDAAKKVTGRDIPVIPGPDRAGDPPILVADSSRLQQKLGWKPRYDSLEYIIKTAWNWEKSQNSNHKTA